MRTIPLSLLLVFYSSVVWAQSTVTGVVRNKDGQPLEAATVLLHRQKDPGIVRSAVTDRSGRFVLDRLAAGSYFLSVTSVGYDGYTGDVMTVVPGQGKVIDVVLSPAAKTLAAASVVTKLPFVQWRPDKLVINVDASPFFNPGQSALDVLERSPGVFIDHMTNIISLNGRPGTTIYINGRLTYLSGQDLLNYLRGLPAGTLDQIEIISQPSAKYDAAGSGGVINIILKKNQPGGVYGSVTASALFGYYFKTRDNLMLNWRNGKFELNFSYGLSDNKTFIDQHTVSSFRSGYGTPFSQYQEDQTSSISHGVSHTPRIAMDYQASRKTSIGVNLTGLFSTNTAITNGPLTLYDSLHSLMQQEQFVSTAGSPVSNFGVNVNLQQKLDTSGEELDVDADYLFYRSPAIQDSYNYLYDSSGHPLPPYLLNGNVPSDIDIYALKADYTLPLRWGRQPAAAGDAGDNQLEAGIKVSQVRTDNNSQYTEYDTVQKKWQPDTTLSNHFIYSEQINAAYIDVSRQLSKKWSVKLGARVEQTISNGNETVQDSRFTKNYVNVFPDAFIGYLLNKDHSFDISYTRGVGRPSYLDLNPFRYVINQYNIREGNPSLAPDLGNNGQFNYHYKNEFTIQVFYGKFDNLLGRVFKSSGQGDDMVTIQTKENIAWRRNVFLSFLYFKRLTKWWNASWVATFVDAKLYDPGNTGGATDKLLGAKVYLNNQFPLRHGWSLDLHGYYGTRWLEGIRIHNLPAGYFSAGVGKKVMKDRGMLTFEINDPLRLYQPGQSTEAAAFFIRTNNRPESRYLTVTFNYRFGKQQAHKRQDDGSAEEEQRRVNL